MRINLRPSLKALLLAMALVAAVPAWSASFVYHGSLSDRGEPAEGPYGFRLTFYDAQTGGRALAPSIAFDGVAVSRGAFKVDLDLDPKLEQRDTFWLAVEVRDASGGFIALDRREAVQPKATAAGTCWDTTGNSGNVDGTNFLGNIDNVPLDVRANNRRFLRIEPVDSSSYGSNVANIIAGSPANTTGTARGATVGGGGTDVYTQLDCGDCGNAATGDFSVVSGGFRNQATDLRATVAGGYNNRAVFESAAVGGGGGNRAFWYGTVPGGTGNCAGGFASLAAGFRAVVRPPSGSTDCPFVPTGEALLGDKGTFVWSDYSVNSEFTSTGPNQFLVRAAGGIGLNTNDTKDPGTAEIASLVVQGLSTVPGTVMLRSPKGSNASFVHYGASGDWYIRSAVDYGSVVIQDQGGQVGIGTSNVEFGHQIDTGAFGAYLSSDGVWTDASSRWFKQDFAAVDPGDILSKVLALELSSWSYRNSTGHRHLGPMAEDFADAFGVGDDAQHLAPLDVDGVALAAIQGLNSKLEAENARLERANGVLRADLERIADRLADLERRAR